MNCKPGDLAFVVHSGRNAGKIVRVLRASIYRAVRNSDGRLKHGQIWEIDGALLSWSGEPVRYCHDDYLRPIRDQDGDESFIRKVPVDDQINVLRKINQRKKVGA
jgi:hypothetical protein